MGELDTIPLDSDYRKRLEKIAAHLGLTPEEVATQALDCFSDSQLKGVKELVSASTAPKRH